MYKAVIFDLDGTLLNTIGDLASAGNYTLSRLGLPLHTVEEYMGYVGNGIPKLIERMVPQSTDAPTLQQAAEIFDDYYQQHKADTTAPYPGLVSLLDTLAAQGIQAAVLSNKKHCMTQPIVQHYFGDRFAAIQGLDENTPAKPDPTGVNRLLARLGQPKNEVLYVGDSDTDMATAQAAGLTACGVLWGFRSREVLLAGGAHYLCADAEELKRLILG